MKPFFNKIWVAVMLSAFCVFCGCGSSPESTDTVFDSQDVSSEKNGSDESAQDTGSEKGDSSPYDTMTGEAPDSAGETRDTGEGSGTAENITVHYEEGQTQGGPIVYVMWLENAARTFVQNLYVCDKLLDGSLTGVALPQWQLNKKDKATVDGVSGATQHPQITVSRKIASEAGAQFTVFVELDHSWDGNDWFNDQPALVYAADVDLNNPQTEYALMPVGWTAAKKASVTNLPGAPGFDVENICSDMRYITHSKVDDTFGEVNPEKSATNIVKKLTASIK